MREFFIEKRFADSSIKLINSANEILAEYSAQNLVLTLRQLYYQFVARGLLPNKQSEYKRLGGVISDARLAGLVDWGMMEDRTRYVRTVSTWKSPQEIVNAVADQYKEDIWGAQDWRPEVWIEKDALIGVIEAPCEELRVPYFACRGYSSQSAQYEAGARFRLHGTKKQTPIVFHLGDHDPSGIDMTRDNAERLSMFAGQRVEIRRLALNMDQVEQYNPPPNPAKESDTRSTEYIATYGAESWELDALEPTAIGDLIRQNVTALIDQRRWRMAQRKEESNRAALRSVADRWDNVLDFIND